MSAKLAEEAGKWTELKNKAAAKMVETKVKIDVAKDKIAAKVGAGVAKVVEKVQEIVGLKAAVAGKVVGKVVGKVNDANAKIQQHKATKKQQHQAKIAFVPVTAASIPTGKFVPSSKFVPTTSASVSGIVVKAEIDSTLPVPSSSYWNWICFYCFITQLDSIAPRQSCEYYIDVTFISTKRLHFFTTMLTLLVKK